MLEIKNVCELPAPPEFVWPHYTNAAEWPQWASDIEAATAHGAVQDGATGTCKYRVLPLGRYVISACAEPRCFTLDWTMLATRVRFRHELTAVNEHGCYVVETVSFHGLLALPLGLLERPRVRTDWPAAMAKLGRLALASWRDAGRPSGDVPARRARPRLVAAEGARLDGGPEVVTELRVGRGEP